MPNVPWYNRHREIEPRVHKELTEKAANRIKFVVDTIASYGEIDAAYKQYRAETGLHHDYFEVENHGPAIDAVGTLLQNEDSNQVLTFLELLIDILWAPSDYSKARHSAGELLRFDNNIRRILNEEGILLRLQPDRQEVVEYAQKLDKYINSDNIGRMANLQAMGDDSPPSPEFSFRFETLSHESIIESDQQVRALAKEQRWNDALGAYNEAWELYQDEQFTYIIAEKLYNSLESVLEKICVEEQDWNTEEEGVGTYINSCREHGLFEPNDAMVGEWQQIIGGISDGVQRSGRDRKRHMTFDHHYCVLLLHQIGAFLTFLIIRYEERYGE
jgi:tetratricopeptide (TPR) repeat protein